MPVRHVYLAHPFGGCCRHYVVLLHPLISRIPSEKYVPALFVIPLPSFLSLRWHPLSSVHILRKIAGVSYPLFSFGGVYFLGGGMQYIPP